MFLKTWGLLSYVHTVHDHAYIIYSIYTIKLNEQSLVYQDVYDILYSINLQ